jgi:hypothetical protein
VKISREKEKLSPSLCRLNHEDPPKRVFVRGSYPRTA